MSLQLVRLEGELPDGFAALRAEAEAEGHRHLCRLAQEVADTPGIFTALLAAFEDGVLVGVGGLTPEPADPSAQRMRRLFVAARARRRGVASTLAGALLQEALQRTRRVTVHAGNPEAERFWEALGYVRVEGRAWSHELFAG